METTETNDRPVVYQLNGPPLEIPVEDWIPAQRSRSIARNRCRRKAFIEYHAHERGLVSSGWNEHIEIGITVHNGLAPLIKTGDLGVALEIAGTYFSEARPALEWLPPQTDEILYNDAFYLCQGLIYAFAARRLDGMLERFEVISSEEEINWLLGWTKDHRPIVMMSRPDGVLRDKVTGQLWHLSFKTAAEYDEQRREKLDIDQQKWSEGYAIQAKYGEKIAGTIYYYLLKGRQSEDKTLKVKRWTSGLVCVYLNELATENGVITPENLHWGYIRNKGWRKCYIYSEHDYAEYLEWLEQGYVQPDGNDWLDDIVVGPIEVEWDDYKANRWRVTNEVIEDEWDSDVSHIDPYLATQEEQAHFDKEFPVQDEEQCFSYRSRCPQYHYCWHNIPLAQLKAENKLEDRRFNHSQEGGYDE